ncbi:hypothetical protein RRG51_03920 [Mycoplasmopsis cynos]|uniref:hypothetical protein n=1 Tax=Mycoplasmopsis cynos TaxID=171284 RepID=UPI002AFE596E|nr:hypothetical protein [Mycoplasmopsis cynos]WQQ16131.1 hypothetical protein RRG51_03920 [Mycoplasmopsis cynos]
MNTYIDDFMKEHEIKLKYRNDIAKLFYAVLKLGKKIYKVKDTTLSKTLDIKPYSIKKFLPVILKDIEDLYSKKLDYIELETDSILEKWIL